MRFIETDLKGAYIIELEPKEDERGFFARIFCQNEFKKNGIDFNIVQCNISYNKKKGTIRGMHYQVEPYEEAKLVICIKGAIYDVAIDLRENSPTYGQWVAVELSEENKKMFLIPKGFAHGFQTLTDNCEVLYLMSEFYSPEHSAGVRWDDPFFNIKWPLEPSVISEKDKNWPLWKGNQNSIKFAK